jgi:hypothetical protein
VSVPGLDASHIWNNAITLQGDSDAILTPPYYLIRKLDGWRSLPDTEDSAETAQGRPGEIPRATRRAGKTVAYECVCVGRTPIQMHEGMDALLEAFQDTDPDGEMVVSPFTASFGSSYFYRARVLALISDDEWIAGPSHTRSGGWERAFIVSLRMHDPHFYSTTAVSATGTAWTTGATGMPWAWTNNSAFYSVNSVYVDVTDTGKANAEPVIDLYGPFTGPRVVNELAKVGLRFDPNLVIPSGQSMRLDFRRRATLYQNLIDIDSYRVQENSDWWDDGVPGLVRGVTQRIRFGARITGSGMKVIVNFNPRRL